MHQPRRLWKTILKDIHSDINGLWRGFSRNGINYPCLCVSFLWFLVPLLFVPSIDFFVVHDFFSTQEVDIAEELIRLSHAQRMTSPPNSPSANGPLLPAKEVVEA